MLGVSGLIFTALKYNRDDTTAIVGQQSTILANMATLGDELRASEERVRTERDALKLQNERLTGQVEALQTELRLANAQLSGQVSRIERKLDEGEANGA